ncbi:MAG: alkaline phosphatase family protein [Candidatus Hodarchaeota archaeon]
MRDNVSIFVMVDALGWELIKDRRFLDDILPFRKPLRTILGYSSAAQPTILSGKTPSEHGHWSMFYYSPNGSRFWWTQIFSVLPSQIISRRPVRKLIQTLLKKIADIDGYFNIYSIPLEYLRYFEFCENHDIYAPGGLDGIKTIFDILVEKKIPYECHNWRTPEQENIRNILGSLDQKKCQFYFLYLPELDAIMHDNGTHSLAVTTKLLHYEKCIRKIYAAAHEKFNDVRLFVFSDHGMTDLIGTHNLLTEIKKLNLKFRLDYLAFYDSTMARFWFFSNSARKEILNLLSQLQCGSLLSDDELKSQQIFFQDKRYGEAIFLMKPGYQIQPSFMSKKPLNAMHGYHPDHKNSLAILMSNKPIVKEATTIVNLYEIMSQELEEILDL